MSNSVVDLTRADCVAVLTINNPPVNALSVAVRSELVERVNQIASDESIKAAVLICAGKTFVAGADIRELGKKLEGPDGRAAFDAIESSDKPFIAALHGTALGGGLELALASHYRIAVVNAKVGLPEVNIGLLPGAGGTQRFPRLTGAAFALEAITSGRHIDAQVALKVGILDELVDGTLDDLRARAVAFANRVIDEKRPLRRVRDNNDRIQSVDPGLFNAFRKKNERKWAGLMAPQYIVECIEAACRGNWQDGYAVEKQRFEELKTSAQREALSYLFFAEREAAKIPNVSPELKPQQVRSVAIIGAGTMGGGIAMSFANRGIPVVQLEVSQEALNKGRALVSKNYESSVARGSTSQAAADTARSLIMGALDYEQIADCDLVIEAAFEDMPLKKEIFSRLDKVCKPEAVLATNTSGLSIDEIALATSRPEMVVGTHFFSPANVMKLLECVRGKKSSPQALVTAMGLAKQLDKVAVLAGNCPGFIGNRVLATYGREADFLLEEGATPWQIDNALKQFGLPMGLYLMRDMAGLDVGWRMRKGREATRDKSQRYSTIADRICERGRFGQKTGAGYYLYSGRDATPDPAIEQLIVEVSKQSGIERQTFSDSEIVDRILIAMVNEGAKVVGEGFAVRSSDIDVTYVFGYGFPRYRGGPMYWAERQGLDHIYGKVQSYNTMLGAHWLPAPLLAAGAKLGTWLAAEASLKKH